MTGRIFDIQHFSLDDGPGIRTTVFLKGCPLSCLWCHNPEGISPERELFFSASLCTLCEKCGKICREDCHSFSGKHRVSREHCTLCADCTRVCPTQALRIVGRDVSVEEVLQETEKDRIFYDRTGGGLTLSGGEPLFQPEFAAALLKAAKEKKFSTCVETSGFCSKEAILKVAEVTDLFLFDWKESDPVLHKKNTGVTNETILENLYALNAVNAKVVLRCPVIPECNDRKEHFLYTAELARKLPCVGKTELLPYHPYGADKYESLGKEYRYGCHSLFRENRAAEFAALVAKHSKKPAYVG